MIEGARRQCCAWFKRTPTHPGSTACPASSGADTGDDGGGANAEEDDDDDGGGVVEVLTNGTLLHSAVGNVDIEFAIAAVN